MSTRPSQIQDFILDSALLQRAAKNKPENMQIVHVRFDDSDESMGTARDDLILAIDKTLNSEFCSSSVSCVFDAYPIISKTGAIDYDSPLVVKIIKESERKLSNPKALPQNPLQWQSAKPNKIHRDGSVKTEARNNRLTEMYSRTGLIAKSNINEELIICERVLVMPKAPGIALAKADLRFLTQEHRIRLALNVIEYFDKKLHHNEKGPIIQRDIKAENIIVDLQTLQLTVLDIDSSHTSEETKAPEDLNEPNFGNIKSDIYSLAFDVLTLIFSGLRSKRNENGDIINSTEIKDKIIQHFTAPGFYSVPNSVSRAIQDLLEAMCDREPEKRTDLEIAAEILITQLQVIAGNKGINANTLNQEQEMPRTAHSTQLNTLRHVLTDTRYQVGEASTDKKASKNRFAFHSGPRVFEKAVSSLSQLVCAH